MRAVEERLQRSHLPAEAEGAFLSVAVAETLAAGVIAFADAAGRRRGRWWPTASIGAGNGQRVSAASTSKGIDLNNVLDPGEKRS